MMTASRSGEPARLRPCSLHHRHAPPLPGALVFTPCVDRVIVDEARSMIGSCRAAYESRGCLRSALSIQIPRAGWGWRTSSIGTGGEWGSVMSTRERGQIQVGAPSMLSLPQPRSTRPARRSTLTCSRMIRIRPRVRADSRPPGSSSGSAERRSAPLMSAPHRDLQTTWLLRQILGDRRESASWSVLSSAYPSSSGSGVEALFVLSPAASERIVFSWLLTTTPRRTRRRLAFLAG